MRYRGLDLDPFQEDSIRHLMTGDSVLVSAPTGNGKTIIADWIVEEALAEGKEVIYTAPVKALSNQKYRDYTRLHGEEHVGLVTGDLVINPGAPIRVMTTEILRNMLLAGQEFDNLMAVVIDEIHFLDDPQRGTVWEEVLIYLPVEVQIVGLSATLSNLDDFAEWLEYVRERPMHVVRAFERVVPLHFHYACKKTGMREPKAFKRIWKRKQHKYRKKGKRRRGRPPRYTRDTDLFRMMQKEDLLPFLYFVFSRKNTEMYARGLARHLDHSLLDRDERRRLDARLERAKAEIGPALSDHLLDMYGKGIAFHHAGTHVSLKALVEELYEEKLIKVLYCTSTFALGINMPAKAVVFDGIMKFNGVRIAPLTTRGFMQKAGRAGRRGMDDEGHVVVRVELEQYHELKGHLKKYQKNDYEPVRSGFNLSWNSIVNLLDRLDEQQIKDLVAKSFRSWTLAQKVDRQLEHASHLEDLSDDDSKKSQRRRREAKRLRQKARRAGDVVWNDFKAKVGFLQQIGYLDEDNEFNAGARILRHLQIEEIFVTELVLEGILDELDPPTLFGVLCGLTNELGRHVERAYRITDSDRRLVKRINAVRGSRAVVQAEELADTEELTWDPDLIPLGRSWAEGKSLQDIMEMVSSQTDVAGDLIGGFRRAKDLAGQLRDVWQEVPSKAKMVAELVRDVTRDEVEVLD